MTGLPMSEARTPQDDLEKDLKDPEFARLFKKEQEKDEKIIQAARAQSEGDLKLALAEHLTYLRNQGKLYFERLNSGDFIETRGNSRRRIKGARKGTADFIVLFPIYGKRYPLFIETKSEKGAYTKEQVEFAQEVKALGFEYWTIRPSNLAEAMKALE